MEIAIVTGLFAKGDMNVDASQGLRLLNYECRSHTVKYETANAENP